MADRRSPIATSRQGHKQRRTAKDQSLHWLDPLEFSAQMAALRRQYEAGDLTAALEASFLIWNQHGEIMPVWFLEACQASIVDKLKRESVTRTSNRFARLQALAEDYVRYHAVEKFLASGMNRTQAFNATARDRMAKTGVQVSGGAIRQSCRRIDLRRTSTARFDRKKRKWALSFGELGPQQDAFRLILCEIVPE